MEPARKKVRTLSSGFFLIVFSLFLVSVPDAVANRFHDADLTTSDSKTTDGTGTGSFASPTTESSAGTDYGSGRSVNSTGATQCADCSGDSVVVQNQTFSSGTVCECVGTTSIIIGPGVKIKSGATVTFKAPSVKLKSAFDAEKGSSVNIVHCPVPLVTTVSATSVSGGSATLNGTVNPNGSSTTYYFQYGTTTSYGSITSSTGAGSGTSNISVSADISGLTSLITYHYRLVATNSEGTSYSSDRTFTNDNTIVTEEYWILKDGRSWSFTNGGQMTLSYVSYNPHITEDVFHVDYPGAGFHFLKYDESGNLMYYGAKYGSEWVYMADSEQKWFPDVMEPGKTYTAGWARKEYNSAGTYLGQGRDSMTIAVTGPASITVPAGTFTVYKLHVVDTWTNYSGETGVSTYDYWLAKGIGWVKMTRDGITYELKTAAPSAATGQASSDTAASATLTGTVNPTGLSTTYYFQYGKTKSYGSTTKSTSAGSGTGNVSSSAGISSLAANTAYHYRLVATNSAGTSYGDDKMFVTDVSADQPTVTTGSASSVTASSATLNGTVNPNGTSTTYYFQYGTTTSYGLTTKSTSAGSGTGNVSSSAGISSLAANTAYHYRLVATNSAGTSYGDDKMFVTDVSADQPTVTTGSASSVTASSATLNGTVNPNGTSTTYYFQYGTTTSYGLTTKSTSAGSGTGNVSSSAGISSLAANTAYHYRLVATNSAGTSYGDDKMFVTDVSADQPTVTTGSASSVTASSATLNGTVNPNGTSTTYYFQYGTTTSYGLTTKSTSAGSGTGNVSSSAGISSLAANTAYHYRLVATNSAGTSYGDDKMFVTDASADQPTVTTGSASSVTASSATLSGTVNPNGASTTYYFQYGTTTSYGSTTTSTSAGSGSSNVSAIGPVSGLICNTTYHYRLVATNSAGTNNGSDKTFTTSDCPADPPTVTTGSATSVTADTATLNGTVNPNGSSTTYYFQYGKTLAYGTTTPSTNAGAGSSALPVNASISGLSADTIYYFQIVATNSGGTSYGGQKSFTAVSSLGTYTNSLGQSFVLIPAGTFTMGSPVDEPGRHSNEGPQHQVTLTQPFYMQTTEVTQAEWEAVMGSIPSNFSGCATCPVENVSWNDVQNYISYMNTRGEGTYGLPTEAQWEYAARAGSSTAFANGPITNYQDMWDCEYDPNLDEIGWYCYNAGSTTHAVGQKKANAWGLYDMSGNVFEWCQDWWGSYPSSAVTDPAGPSSGLARVKRGGSWNYGYARYCRSANRSYDSPADSYSHIGVRLLRQP